jgi:hypothetical protein
MAVKGNTGRACTSSSCAPGGEDELVEAGASSVATALHAWLVRCLSAAAVHLLAAKGCAGRHRGAHGTLLLFAHACWRLHGRAPAHGIELCSSMAAMLPTANSAAPTS